jgi:hypothetical protein
MTSQVVNLQVTASADTNRAGKRLCRFEITYNYDTYLAGQDRPVTQSQFAAGHLLTR